MSHPDGMYHSFEEDYDAFVYVREGKFIGDVKVSFTISYEWEQYKEFGREAFDERFCSHYHNLVIPRELMT